MSVLLWLLLLFGDPQVQANPMLDVPVMRNVELAHDYHGIKISRKGLNGEHTFKRGKIKCRLFTDGCQQYIQDWLTGF